MFADAMEHIEGAQEAYDLLRPFADFVDDSITLFYNLGCYACVLGNLDEARNWLGKTFAMSENCDYGSHYREMARTDAQLKPLWREISVLGLVEENDIYVQTGRLALDL